MPCTCSIVGLFAIEYEGIISATLTGSSEFIEIVSLCDVGPNIFTTARKHLKGPSTGTLNLTAYAFEKGSLDKFLGTSCPSSAGISFPSQSRFDCESNLTRIIRTKTGEVFREGDPITGITLLGEFCTFRTLSANASSGPFSRVTDTERTLGTDLIWAGFPFAFDSQDPDTLDFTILGLDVKLTNFSVSVSVPQPATNNYTFQYSLPSCEGDLF
jgi:hypothetical protein